MTVEHLYDPLAGLYNTRYGILFENFCFEFGTF